MSSTGSSFDLAIIGSGSAAFAAAIAARDRGGTLLAAENALNGATRTVDLRALPRVTFTSPQIASAGLTEAQARSEGRNVKTWVLPLSAVPRAIVNRETRGLIKMVVMEL